MGFDEQGGLRVHAPTQAASAKDAPSQTRLKERQPGQGTIEELAVRDFKAELEAKERKHFKLDAIEDFEKERENDRKQLEELGTAGAAKGLHPNARDADDVDPSDDSDSEGDDSDDEMEALQAELAKIRAEKEAEKKKAAAEAAAKADEEAKAELIKNNPILRKELGIDDEPTFQIKRRWDDDVVFKNQARTEPKRQKRFINDTVRSDFHKRFLDRYIK
eukprot:jgi/Ulvmu1/10516/UM064_0054.1